MTKMTVTEGLVKLKLTEKKIKDALQPLFVGANVTKGAKAFPHGFQSAEAVKQEATRQLDSIQGLMNYRDSLKRAIVLSNAVTKVTVGTQSMTVAEAIEQKTSIAHKKTLLVRLNNDFVALNSAAEKYNSGLERQVDTYLGQIFATNANASEAERQAARKNWLDSNTMQSLYADKTKETIDRLKADTEEFETNVDVSLTIANSQTYIEI